MEDAEKRIASVIRDAISFPDDADGDLSLVAYCSKYQDCIFVVTPVDGKLKCAPLTDLPAATLLRHLHEWERAGFRPCRSVRPQS
jgi:hypothetical protein